MAKRQGALEDLFEFASKLSWQVNVVLGILSFVVLHTLARGSAGVPSATQSGQLGSVAVVSGIHAFAAILQLIVPLGFFVGAIASFIMRERGARLYRDATADPGKTIGNMSWREFESLIGEAFRRRGFDVVEHGGSDPDGGVDLAVTKDGKRYLVQCKHWRTQQVGVSVVRELRGVVSVEEAAGGYVVTGGTFTREAQQFAGKAKVELVDGETLKEWIGGAAGAPASVPVKTSSPSCPECGAEMVRRVAKKGKFSRRSFWGCREFPKCTGIVQIS